MKLEGDHGIFPGHKEAILYVSSRTSGKAMDAVRLWQQTVNLDTARIEDLWYHLDQFFYNPSEKTDAATWLRTARQGNKDFQTHFQEFQVQLAKAALGVTPEARKIEMLKITLNDKLLDKLAATYVERETFDSFVKRCKQIWDNMMFNINARKPTYGQQNLSGGDTPTRPAHPDSMDWQTGPVAAAQFRSGYRPSTYNHPRTTQPAPQTYNHSNTPKTPQQTQRGRRQRGTSHRFGTSQRPPPNNRYDGCFNCGAFTHIARDCPDPPPRPKHMRGAYAVDVDEVEELESVEDDTNARNGPVLELRQDETNYVRDPIQEEEEEENGNL
jgi:Zinc knuckle